MKNEGNEGLDLFIRFAYGAAEKGFCSGGQFVNRMNLYLFGGKLTFGEAEIKREFKTAWPQLELIAGKINRKPLDLETVSVYVFGSDDPKIGALSHNQLPQVKRTPCAVYAGIVKRVVRCENIVYVHINRAMKGNPLIFTCSLNQAKSMKKGDRAAYHVGHLIGKITEKQFRRLKS